MQSGAQHEQDREGRKEERGEICEGLNVIKQCLCSHAHTHTHIYIVYFSTHAHSHHALAHNGVLKIGTLVPSNCSI